MKKQKYSEQVLDWCNEFENEIFLSPSIQTYKVHKLANDYIRLRNQFENKKYFISEIKREIFKRISALEFFEGNEKLLKEEISDLLSSEFKYDNIEETFSPFKKDIVKSLYKKDNVTQINPKESSLLYDLGIADWNYVKSHFTHKIKDAYLHEAMAWIVSFVQSGDYNPDEIIVKNNDGKILKDETFLNILSEINNKAISSKPPFDIKSTSGEVFYNKMSDSSIDVRLWNEKEQRLYGGISSKMRNFTDAHKTLEAFCALASENAIINEIKSRRKETVVSSERVNQLVNMKLYHEVREDFIQKSEEKMPSYETYEFFTKIEKDLMVIKGALNNDVYYKNGKNITKSELLDIKERFSSSSGVLFLGDLLNKVSSHKGLFAGMFLTGFEETFIGKENISIEPDALEDYMSILNIEFSGYRKTGVESARNQEFLFKFLLKNKNDLKNDLSLMSEKSVYKEERDLLFTNFKKCFNFIEQKGLEDGLKVYFNELKDEDIEQLVSVFENKDFYKEFKDKIGQIKVSQHESAILKNNILEKAFGILISQNPSVVGSYVQNKEDKGIDSKVFAEIEEWKSRFIEDVVLSDNKALSEVIMDEFFVLRNKYSEYNLEALLKENLSEDEKMMKYFPDKNYRDDFINLIFSEKDKEVKLKDSVENLGKEIPFNIKLSSGFLENEERMTKWGFISKYFDNQTKKSTIKEANGWVVGFLKNGDFSHYKFSKSKNISTIFPEILENINKYSLTEKEPFVFKNNKIYFQEASAGEVDVEFWDVKQKKINGMSITRHQGVEIEGNQFIRHPLKLFAKSIILREKGAFIDADSIKSTPMHKSDTESWVNSKMIKEKVLSDIYNGDEFAKNLSIAREFIRKNYGINYHSSGYVVSENEMDLLLNEMNKTINYSFYGEIRNKSSFPELNAGLTNIAYVENIRNVGNFKLSIKASEMFIGNLNTYYNGINEKSDIESPTKKILFNLLRDNPMNESVIEYFSEPNSHRDERETLIQSMGVFLDKVREEYDFCNDETLFDAINDFFGEAVSNSEKEEFLESFKSGDFISSLSNNLSGLKLSFGESKKRYELLNDKMKNMEKLLSLKSNEEIGCSPCIESFEKRSRLRINN